MPDSTTRPIVATIFGVLDIVFGVLGISSLHAFSLSLSFGLFINIALVIVSLLAVVAGVFLFKDRPVALKLNLHFSCASIGMAVIWLAYGLITGGLGGLMNGILPIAINILFPVLVMVILLKDAAVKKFYRST
ncbi:MAG TPA: hypothetical protein PK307_09155 [Spirochaetota bacterium]|nr:hypothetical protein [Spirochaetota bacterium]HOD16432.1 hypothetical protein [Spirochaetota bacterium]HPG51815.1 hypothetical protein [Spirochaetota bacterium]HPN11136.1 hypothetical protein [Spirochaetota bacterium]HQL82355.1 hypothetical protein [Spirochaetota bacterium]